MTSKTIGEIYSQINPDVIGSERRNLEIAKQYGMRLAAKSKNARSSHTVPHFVGCYPSHDFIIDDDEAKKWFLRVVLPSEELYNLVGVLGQPAYSEADDALIVALTPKSLEENDDADAEQGGDSSNAGESAAVDESGSADRPSDPSPAKRGDGSR